MYYIVCIAWETTMQVLSDTPQCPTFPQFTLEGWRPNISAGAPQPHSREAALQQSAWPHILFETPKETRSQSPLACLDSNVFLN